VGPRAGLDDTANKVSLCLTKHHEDAQRSEWSECIDPRFLGLGNNWRSVVNFTLRTLYPGEEPVPTA
jgi:hypothetical protein